MFVAIGGVGGCGLLAPSVELTDKIQDTQLHLKLR